MDTSDTGIVFDKNGVCNHCHSYDEMRKYFPNIDNIPALEKLFDVIKKKGNNNKYDCIIGLSGGMDSSYVTYLAYKYHLRPLLVHLDNGWDADLATENVSKIVKKTGFDIVNYKIDDDEFISIQKAYIEANVVDIEVPSDLAIISIINKMALKYNIKYILSGLNVVTEFTMGKDWNYTKTDRSNFEAIVETKNVLLRTYPYFTPQEQLIFKIRNIQIVNILQYINYDVNKIERVLNEIFEWNNYKVKHGESIFTLFYQTYYLPQKHNIDKRKAHLSDLIRSGNITRNEAIEILKNSPLDKIEQDTILQKVLDKLKYSKEEFASILKNAPVPHSEYSSNTYYGSVIDKLFEYILNQKKIVTALRLLYGKFHD